MGVKLREFGEIHKDYFLELIDDILFYLGHKIKSEPETLKQWTTGIQWIMPNSIAAMQFFYQV